VEYDFVHLDNYRKFSDALPNAKLVDVGQPTMKMRILKSPEDIELINKVHALLILVDKRL